MMIESNYEINIAKLYDQPSYYKPLYTHYARVELGNISERDALNKYEELTEIFPKDKFKLTLMRVSCSGQFVKGDY